MDGVGRLVGARAERGGDVELNSFGLPLLLPTTELILTGGGLAPENREETTFPLGVFLSILLGVCRDMGR